VARERSPGSCRIREAVRGRGGLDRMNHGSADSLAGELEVGGGFFKTLGLQVEQATPDAVTLGLTIRDDLLQPYGILHGGVHCSMVESAASIAAALWYGDRGQVVGVSNHTDFLRATNAGRLTARATPVYRGRSQQLWQVDVTDDRERLVARGQLRLHNIART
jgi:1,4-dihydroxy-2-naphthoyl-CoA hydrolase